MPLTDYLKQIYENSRSNWNVESALPEFGEGKSNKGTQEYKAIKRYYVAPKDERFWQIFLNYDNKNNINSIAWFLQKDEIMTLGELKSLFGSFEFKNIAYDGSTELIFFPKSNKAVKHITTNIFQWLEKRNNNTFYYKEEGNNIELTDDYQLTNILFAFTN